MKEIKNSSDYMMFYDISKNILYENIWDLLTIDTIKNTNYSNHFDNTSFLIQSPDNYNTVIPNIYPIPSRSKWVFSNNVFKCTQSLRVSKNSLDTDYIISKIIEPLKKYKIGVELSGGLDSSLIISAFKKNKINPYLIGFYSKRFEFRTECHIQDLYKKDSNEHMLIDSNEILPFQNLLDTPKHQLPYHSSLWYFAKKYTGMICNNNNIDILFNGMAGDAIFCEEVGDSFPRAWYNWMMDYGWFNEYVFKEFQMKYLPVYSKVLIEQIYKLRIGQDYDAQKNWARQYFKNYLPKELVDFNYKADHIGELIAGIKNSSKEVIELFRLTYEVTRNKEFTEDKLRELYDNIEKYDDKQLTKIFAKVSYANWVYSILK